MVTFWAKVDAIIRAVEAKLNSLNNWAPAQGDEVHTRHTGYAVILYHATPHRSQSIAANNKHSYRTTVLTLTETGSIPHTDTFSCYIHS